MVTAPAASLSVSAEELRFAQAMVERARRAPSLTFEEAVKVKGPGFYLAEYFGDFPVYVRYFEKVRTCFVYDDFLRVLYAGSSEIDGITNGDWKPGKSRRIGKRIEEHGETISSAVGIELKDFRFRCIETMGGNGVAGESWLIREARPLWNSLKGFGPHDRGSTRATTQVSRMEALHEIDHHSKRNPNAKPRSRESVILEIKARAEKLLRAAPLPTILDMNGMPYPVGTIVKVQQPQSLAKAATAPQIRE